MKSLIKVAAFGAFLATAAQFAAASAAETMPASTPAATATQTVAQSAPAPTVQNGRARKRAEKAAVAQPAPEKSAYEEALELNEKIRAFMPLMSGDGGGGR